MRSLFFGSCSLRSEAISKTSKDSAFSTQFHLRTDMSLFFNYLQARTKDLTFISPVVCPTQDWGLLNKFADRNSIDHATDKMFDYVFGRAYWNNDHVFGFYQRVSGLSAVDLIQIDRGKRFDTCRTPLAQD